MFSRIVSVDEVWRWEVRRCCHCPMCFFWLAGHRLRDKCFPCRQPPEMIGRCSGGCEAAGRASLACQVYFLQAACVLCSCVASLVLRGPLKGFGEDALLLNPGSTLKKKRRRHSIHQPSLGVFGALVLFRFLRISFSELQQNY